MGNWSKEKRQIMAMDMDALEEKRQRKLNLNQRKFIKYYLETGEVAMSYYRAYHCRNKTIAQVAGSRLLKTLDFTEILEMAGASDSEIAKGMTEGLHATKVTRMGKVVPDLDLRHKYIVTALEAKNKIKKKLEVTGENGEPIRFNILAGHGFIPTVPRSEPSNGTPTPNTIGGPPKVQDSNMASESPKDNNSNN